MAGFCHLPVLPAEVLSLLAPRPGGIYVDGTLGGAGHARMILEASAPDGMLIGFDRDPAALAAARERLAPYGDRVKFVRSNYAAMGESLAALGIDAIDGFLLDIGVSSHQLDTAERGFSFQVDAPLDMRMDPENGATAADLVNELSLDELARIIREYGEERWAKRIASFIVKAREQQGAIESTLQLVDCVKGAIPRSAWEERIHPATRTFQALRIAVNDELGSLERGLAAGIEVLAPGGRGVVISFHSLEDRIVKTVFRQYAQGCICPKMLPQCVCGNTPRVRILTGKPVMAGDDEVAANPRARSAKVRAVEKL
ncbi:16S rRNA (cytosine(1402)-N(4))-methyltransferase RsmH [Geobacter benzoatilyticus]|uniref:Ribosomal RNA small subunit methyltransferase H n=1 Tax=Geobacter benzoatilyticus TaxID=2815309 RepID=A0ABX7Q8F6_9BACT|nr:16S rRNA (cytosine(1402)-N(4))-methyltransferase RsmH [Geobacter benzoatilyticus]QSV47131.1 16S rRNA (cytosine(1402)-N(4))-methyltransferase RsmH [Geobacter benzoatilyticus]